MKTSVIIFLFVFASSALAELPQWMKNQAFVDKFVYESTAQFELENPEKIRSIAQLNNEEREEYTDYYNGPEVGAKSHKFYFDGLEVRGFYIPGKRFFLTYVNLTSSEFKVAGPIEIGSSEVELKEYFKHPGQLDGNVITYSSEAESVSFTLENDVVIKIEFFGYTG